MIIDKQGQNGTTIFHILDNTTESVMTKYIIGEIFSSGGATLYKNPSDQTVYNYLIKKFGFIWELMLRFIFICVWKTFRKKKNPGQNNMFRKLFGEKKNTRSKTHFIFLKNHHFLIFNKSTYFISVSNLIFTQLKLDVRY